MKMINIIIFGTGLFYQRRKKSLPECTNIVAFIDNNIKVQGNLLDGSIIINPSDLSSLTYDYVILASIVPNEMKKQLLEMGIDEKKILYWEQYVSENSHGRIEKYVSNTNGDNYPKKALIIVPIVNYAGGFMTAFCAGQVLKSKGYYVVVAAPIANDMVIQEVNKEGIDVWICPSIPYIKENELTWMEEFEIVLANSLQTMICAERIARRKKVLWWLHEHSGQYEDIISQYSSEVDETKFDNIEIYAVSKLARNNFLKHFATARVGVLPFGMNDMFVKSKDKINQKIVFSVVGNISALKNQMAIVRTFTNLSAEEKEISECWIIGRDGGKKYKEELVSNVEEKNYIKLCGEYTREEMQRAYSEIDVVICTSKEETMSMTIVEGMMNAKICITNTNTGIAEYIQNGVNGFIYEEGNENHLLEIVKYIINNFSKLNQMRASARETYKKFFSMEMFSGRLMEIFEER